MLYVKEILQEDLEAIAKIDEELYHKPWSAKDFENELKNNPYAYYFKMVNSDNNDEIVGYIGFWILFERAEITKVSIVKKYQGYKLSNILMEDLEKRVRLANCENITLEVRVSNERAINLYKKHGFSIVATRKKYYDNGEDAYLMLKELKYDNTCD